MKLVLSDMDGTLLNERKELPHDFFEVVKALQQRDVLFAIASGRQYYTLLEQFPNLEKEMLFICENGTIVFEKGTCIYVNEIERSKLYQVLDIVRNIEGVYPIFCGVNSAYIEDDHPLLVKKTGMYYHRLKRVARLEEVIGVDRICKVALYDTIGAAQNAYPKCKKLSGFFSIVTSGKEWVDIANPLVSKGKVVHYLKERYGLSPQDCYAFGDYHNDIEMLQEVYHSVAVANAHEDVAAVCRFHTLSNEEEGVMHYLKQAFHLKM